MENRDLFGEKLPHKSKTVINGCVPGVCGRKKAGAGVPSGK